MAIYMQVSGVIGDASQSSHTGWIPLQNVKLPTERPDVNTKPGNVTDRTTSAVDFKDVEITKFMDRASPDLMKWNIKGDTRTVTIEVCKEEGKRVLQLVLSNVILTNYDSDSDEEGKVEENISLDYTKIEYKYTAYNKDQTEADTYVASYDLETAAAPA